MELEVFNKFRIELKILKPNKELNVKPKYRSMISNRNIKIKYRIDISYINKFQYFKNIVIDSTVYIEIWNTPIRNIP